MTFKTTRWSPDTCGCIVEYDWDDAVSQEQRSHLFRGTVNACLVHAALAGEAHYNTVAVENRTKNRATHRTGQAVRLINPALIEQMYLVFPPGGILTPSETEDYKDSLASRLVEFAYGANRVLELRVTAITLTNTQKRLLQATLDTQFGDGVVRLL